MQITGKRGTGVLLSEGDWRPIQETLHLVSIPGMRESILDCMATDVESLRLYVLALVEDLFSGAELAEDLYSCGEARGCGTLVLKFHRASPGQVWPVGKLS